MLLCPCPETVFDEFLAQADAGLFSDLPADEPTLTLCWFCEPASQPAVPAGAEYTFAVCPACRATFDAVR